MHDIPTEGEFVLPAADSNQQACATCTEVTWRRELRHAPLSLAFNQLETVMTAMKKILTGAAVAAVAVMFGRIAAPAAAQPSNQDYSKLPGYSPRPAGKCWLH